MTKRTKVDEKMKIKNENKFGMLRGLTHAFALAAILSSCAKTLPDKEPDFAQETYRTKNSVTSAKLVIEAKAVATQEELSKNRISTDLIDTSVGSEAKTLYSTQIVNSNDKTYNVLVKDLLVFAEKEGQKFEITFDLTTNYLVAYIAPADTSSKAFSASNKIIRDVLPVKASKLDRIPLFQYGVDFYQRENVKNDLEEKTRHIRYIEKDRSESTHYKVDYLIENRTYTGVFGMDQKEIATIYRRDKVESNLFTVGQLEDRILNNENAFTTSKHDGHVFDNKDLIKVILDDNESKAYFARVIKKEDLTDNEEKLVRAERFNLLFSRCDADTAKRAKIALENCFLRSEISEKIKYVKFKYDIDDNDEILAETKISSSTVAEDAKFIQLEKDSQPEEIYPTEIREELSTAWLKLEKFKNQEFTFRRVLEDSPNIFNYSFAGSKATFHVEIVKFHFEPDRVLVKRSRPLLDKTGSTNLDTEPLLAFEAEYFRESKNDKGGIVYVPASHNDERAIAVVNLGNDQIGDVLTSLDPYLMSVCGGGKAHGLTEVSDIVQVVDGKDEFLNFSTQSTYKKGNFFNCADFGGDYWGQQNETMTFKERTTFMKYNQEFEEPEQNLSYEVQKKFNFGLFTGSKLVPKGYTEQTRDFDTTVDLPMVFDIRNGKNIEYVLTGIPSNKYDKDGKLIRKLTQTELDLRNKIIVSSQKVVDDINLGFKRAFKGTQYEGRGDVITLKIEKDDSIPAGTKNLSLTHNLDGESRSVNIEVVEKTHLGDLQRNHIYWVEKATSSSIIGLGGPSFNPRNGVVESASVYLYGGNMKSSINWMIDKAIAEKNFVKNITPTKELQNLADELNKKAIEDALAEHKAKTQAAGQATQVANSDEVEVEIEGETVTQSTKKAEMKSHRHGVAHTNLKSNLLKTIKRPNIASQMGKIKDAHRLMKNDFRASSFDKDEVLSNFTRANQKEAKAVHAAWQAIANKDDVALQAAIHGDNSIEALQAKIKHSMEYDAKGNKNPICNHETAEFALSNLAKNYDVLKMAETDEGKNDILIDIWMPTLAHEIGHNLGLRHNFVGSFDKKNWLFAGEKETKRTSSSVMDYTIDDHATYDGLAPYDVYALRAAYTGMVELEGYTNSRKKSIEINGVDVKVSSVESEFEPGLYYHLVRIQDVIDALVGENGNPANISKHRLMAEAGLKRIRFCSDEDAGNSPQCNRHDFGSSFEEIVDYQISDYRQMYEYIYFPGKRKEFYGGAAFGWLMDKFYKLRMMNEEVFYHLIYTPELYSQADQATHDATTNDLVNGVIKSLFFLQSVVATPDITPGAGLDTEAQRNKRFVSTLVPTQTEVTAEDGTVLQVATQKPMVVETKWNEAISLDSDSYRAKNRGIEYDKAAALVALTESESYSYKYRSNSLRIPYQLLEQYLFGIDIKDSIVQSTIGEVLSGQVTPLVYDPATGRNIPLTNGAFSVEVGEVETNYAAIGGLVYGNIDTFEQTANPARAFWVNHISQRDLLTETFEHEGQTYQIPEDYVAEKTDIRKAYVPYAQDSYVAGNVIQKASMMQLISHDERWSTFFGEWEKAQIEGLQLAQTPAAQDATEDTMKAQKTELDMAAALGDAAAIKSEMQRYFAQINALLASQDQKEMIAGFLAQRALIKQAGSYFVSAQFTAMMNDIGLEGVTLDYINQVLSQAIVPIAFEAEACRLSEQYCSTVDMIQMAKTGNKDRYLDNKITNLLNNFSMPSVNEQGQVELFAPVITKVIQGLNNNEQIKLGDVFLRDIQENSFAQIQQMDQLVGEAMTKMKVTKDVDSFYGDMKRNVKLLGLYFRMINPMEGK